MNTSVSVFLAPFTTFTPFLSALREAMDFCVSCGEKIYQPTPTKKSVQSSPQTLSGNQSLASCGLNNSSTPTPLTWVIFTVGFMFLHDQAPLEIRILAGSFSIGWIRVWEPYTSCPLGQGNNPLEHMYTVHTHHMALGSSKREKTSMLLSWRCRKPEDYQARSARSSSLQQIGLINVGENLRVIPQPKTQFVKYCGEAVLLLFHYCWVILIHRRVWVTSHTKSLKFLSSWFSFSLRIARIWDFMMDV